MQEHLDDCRQVGMIGLLRAARDFDPSLSDDFESYAGRRVKGQILDYLRGLGARSVEEAEERACARADWPDAGMTKIDIDRAVDHLPARLRGIIRRHYFGGQSLKSIGRELGVTASWVSQLHRKAIVTLRHAMAA